LILTFKGIFDLHNCYYTVTKYPRVAEQFYNTIIHAIASFTKIVQPRVWRKWNTCNKYSSFSTNWQNV